jgi:hypothetical protein
MPVHVTGTLQTILEGDPEAGTVEVALCGYGSQIPRINAATLGARVTDGMDSIEVSATDGTFAFDCTGNDLIQPAGTYYTVTIRDSNGDIVQVNAYQFLSEQTPYDLNATEPFDPSQSPPPSVPPLVLDLMDDVPYDPAAVFSGDTFTSWQITLAGDCTPSFTNLVEGNLYTVIILQDGQGGHAFTWPANVHNPTQIDPDSDSITVQTFIAMSGSLYAIAPGTYWTEPPPPPQRL